MSRGRALLIAQADRNRPLGDPPSGLTPAGLEAWRDLVAAQPADVFRFPDSLMLWHVAELLGHWRAGKLDRHIWTRTLYRWLGSMLLPMAARRRLLFPDAPPSRSRWV